MEDTTLKGTRRSIFVAFAVQFYLSYFETGAPLLRFVTLGELELSYQKSSSILLVVFLYLGTRLLFQLRIDEGESLSKRLDLPEAGLSVLTELADYARKVENFKKQLQDFKISAESARSRILEFSRAVAAVDAKLYELRERVEIHSTTLDGEAQAAREALNRIDKFTPLQRQSGWSRTIHNYEFAINEANEFFVSPPDVGALRMDPVESAEAIKKMNYALQATKFDDIISRVSTLAAWVSGAILSVLGTFAPDWIAIFRTQAWFP